MRFSRITTRRKRFLITVHDQEHTTNSGVVLKRTSAFRRRLDTRSSDEGKLLATLAKEFVETGTEPPEDRRPVRIEQEIPMDMVEAALNAEY